MIGWRVYMRKTKKRKNRRISNAKKKRMIQRNIRLGVIILIILCILFIVLNLMKSEVFSNDYTENEGEAIDKYRPDIDVELLSVNPYSRPGIKTNKITGIVVHYTANPGSTAMNNRDYFEGLKDTHETKVSSNFVIGL